MLTREQETQIDRIVAEVMGRYKMHLPDVFYTKSLIAIAQAVGGIETVGQFRDALPELIRIRQMRAKPDDHPEHTVAAAFAMVGPISDDYALEVLEARLEGLLQGSEAFRAPGD
jgi:hypothetical protein